MNKKTADKAPQKASKQEKKLTLEQALKLSSQLEKKGLTISASMKKEIATTVSREITSN